MSRTRIDKKQILGWVMYDFANSAYTTLIVTFIYATYFVSAIAPDKIYGTALWSRGVTLTAILAALCSPFLGALADHGNARKLFLFISTIIGAAGCAMLWFVQPGQVYQALFWFVLSNLAFEIGMVFYNAFLPEISSEKTIGRISGVGWGVGYIGGLLAMFVAMAGFISPEVPWFGLSRESGANIRAACLLVAGWYTLFSIPLFVFVKSNTGSPQKNKGKAAIVRAAFADIKATFKDIRAYREIVKLLVARMIYNDGLVTIFAFGGIYAAGTFGFTFQEIMIFGIVLNVAAGTGALIMGLFDDKLGGKNHHPDIQYYFNPGCNSGCLGARQGHVLDCGRPCGVFCRPQPECQPIPARPVCSPGKRDPVFWVLCLFRQAHRVFRAFVPGAFHPAV